MELNRVKDDIHNIKTKTGISGNSLSPNSDLVGPKMIGGSSN